MTFKRKGWQGALEQGIMKKGHRRWQVRALLAAAITGALLLSALSAQSKPWQPGEALLKAAQPLDAYRYELVFHPETAQLAVTMRLEVHNRSLRPYDDLLMRTYAGAFSREETSPAAYPEIYDDFYPQGFSQGGILIQDVLWNDSPAACDFDDTAGTLLRIPIPALEPGEAGNLTLRCVLSLPQSPGRFGCAEDVWTFGNCLPVLSLRDVGGWRRDPYWPIGDPFVSQAANYHVSLSLPDGYTLAASSPLDQSAYALRDWAMVIVKGFTVRQIRVNQVKLLVLSKEAGNADSILTMARKALAFFNKTYGGYPWETLTLVETPFPMGGMEYPGLVILSDSFLRSGNPDGLELTIAHELAHQWFYALVGSDQINQPWQDEALSEWSVLRYVREAYGQSAYENLKALRLDAPMRESIRRGITPASPLSSFQSYQEYTSVVYGRGAAMMEAIELDTGKLDAFLKAYCERYAFSLATRQDFEALLSRFTGRDLSPLVQDYLDTSI